MFFKKAALIALVGVALAGKSLVAETPPDEDVSES
jgi:hypothetical protein